MDTSTLNFIGTLSATICGISGTVMLSMNFLKNYQSKKIGNILIFISVSSLIIQSLLVSYTYTLNENIGSFYLFYAVVVLFTLTFLYVYRFQMNEKYYLYWGIALLYLMGLEIRTIDTIGEYLS
jgi:hypothetical protein|tara:strand:+ start:354 stop:725 length:372 start_codon:yes stop_codon:yes gene_type:complete